MQFVHRGLAMAGLATAVLAGVASAQTAPERNRVVSAAAAARPAATQQRRVALVIGNGNYRDAPLTNPVNDARAVAQALRESGFTVILREDIDMRGMLASLREFGDQLRQGGTGLFYFAGHGMQIKGRNYLIPVGSTIQREDEVAYAAVDAQAVLDKMEAAGNGTNIVILDACRNNPFARSFRSAQQGLAQMDAPVGTLVAFATAPGAVASDGAGQNGLYTQHLLQAMREPGSKVEDVFKRVRAGVRRDSQGKQVPWESTSLEGDFYFSQPPRAEPPDAVLEKAMWDLVRPSSQPIELRAFLGRFPSGRFAADARKRLAELEAAAPAQVAVAAPAVARPPAASNDNADAAEWERLKDSKDLVALRGFLNRFPRTQFATAAVTRILEVEGGIQAQEEQARPATAPVPVASPPATAVAEANAYGVRVGDRWNYQSVDKFRGEVTENWSMRVTRMLPSGEWYTGPNSLVSPEGNFRRYADPRYSSREFSPARVILPSKFEAGFKEPVQFKDVAKRRDGFEFVQDWSGTIEVVRRERVKVPAGEFDAWRIERRLTVQGQQTNGPSRWFGHNQFTVWYAPEVRNVVAWEELHRNGGVIDTNARVELTSYELRGGPTASR